MELDIAWAQGKCVGDAHFVSDEEICYSTGSFIKICSTDKFSEVSLQGPLDNIDCMCADSDLKLIAVASKIIHVINYPNLDIVSTWPADKQSCVIQMCFAGDDYLLTLEGSPYFNLALWNWQKSIKITNIQHKYPIIEELSVCFLSIHPSFTNVFVFQQLEGLHFYEIEDICSTVNLRKNTIYLPVVGDEIGNSVLNEENVENLTYFDKMQHDAWGIHSELLHSFPLQVFCSELPERELVGFNDFLMKQLRLRASCHCWLPNKQLLVACFSGTILSVDLDFSVRIIQSCKRGEEKSLVDNYITCMALNKNGLYGAYKNGDVLFVQDIENWTLTMLISVKECPVRMKFSPGYEKALIVNRSGSVTLMNVIGDAHITYLSTCKDDSGIVGICVASSEHCVTARSSGLIEAWATSTGVPISQFHINEDIIAMEGCPASSAILVSGSSSYIFVIDISAIKELRIVQISRPCEEVIKIIKSETFGRFAIVVSGDRNIFLYDIVPSRNFKVLGYIPMQHDVQELSVFSKGSEDVTFVSLLRKGESDDHIINMAIPKDFDSDFSKYWEDESGLIKAASFKITEINLGTKCCSLVSHLLNGLILHLPSSDEFINIPYENIGTFKSRHQKVDGVNSRECRMFLSPAHYMLLTVDECGDLCVRRAHDYSVIYKQTFYKSSRLLLPFCAFGKDMIFLEACEGVLACLRLPNAQDMEAMPWVSYCQNKRTEEDEILAEMRSMSKIEMIPWITQQMHVYYGENIERLKAEKIALEKEFRRIGAELQNLANVNFSLPQEHQIEGEEFLLDKEAKELLIKSRNDAIKTYETTFQEKLEKIEKDILDIKEECVHNMCEKVKFLTPFRNGSVIYNYPIPIMSEKEKSEMCYSFKKTQLEKCLLKLKLKEVENEDFEEELTFVRSLEEDNTIEHIEDLRKQPFLLQTREERTDYTFILKYIILRRRLAFNRQFDEIQILRKDTEEKIKENNLRIKEILLLLREEEAIWEPSSLDNDHKFQVRDEELENSEALLSEKTYAEPKGIADYFLKDEWLLKLKSRLTQKYRLSAKKDNMGLMKKEIEKKRKVVDALVSHYDDALARLVEDKLRCDLQLNQDELQLYLILFSSANLSDYKKWEIYSRDVIEKLKVEYRVNSGMLRELEMTVSKSEKETEKLLVDSSLLDKEVREISKMSRNKEAFLDAYEKRPIMPVDTKALNPYKEIKTIPENILKELDSIKHKPLKVPLAIWKQMCSLRKQKIALETEIAGAEFKTNNTIEYIQKINNIQNSLKKNITERGENFQKLLEKRIRCGFETPMVLPISDSQLESIYPDDLDFKRALFFKKFHVESLNGMIVNAGNSKLETVQKVAKLEYQIDRNIARVRIDELKLRDMKKEIELVKSIPMTKDIQKIIQDPKGFSLQDKINALEKSKQMEVNEAEKQMHQVTERISNIEGQKDILRKSMREKKMEIEKLKGDIAELRKIESLKNDTSASRK